MKTEKYTFKHPISTWIQAQESIVFNLSGGIQGSKGLLIYLKSENKTSLGYGPPFTLLRP